MPAWCGSIHTRWCIPARRSAASASQATGARWASRRCGSTRSRNRCGSTSTRRSRRITSAEPIDLGKEPMEFTYEANPQRVIFAPGARSRVGEELDRLGVERAMVVTTPSQADVAAQFARLIGERAGIVYPGAQMHTPTNVTEAALTAVSSVKADGILAIGGGSAVGMSKAIALRTDLPQLVVPVTFAGSEMTPILGETERGEKITQRSPKVLPETVIYDPELVSALPL